MLIKLIDEYGFTGSPYNYLNRSDWPRIEALSHFSGILCLFLIPEIPLAFSAVIPTKITPPLRPVCQPLKVLVPWGRTGQLLLREKS